MSTTRDLSQGNILKTILSFGFPIFLGMLFQQCYSIIDTLIVGKALGVNALSGVGSTGSITFLIIGFCNGMSSGCTIPISQKFGEKNYPELRKYVTNSLYLGVIFVAILTLVSCLLCNFFLVSMGTLEEVYQYAYDYLFYIFLGIPILYAYNLLSGIIRAFGDSKSSVYFLVIGIIVNILLDYLFMVVFRYGVESAAIATVISQAVSAILCLIFIIKKFPFLKASKEEWKFSFQKNLSLLWMGLPMGLQYSITAIGCLIVTVAVNALNSTTYVAAFTASSKLNGFFCCPFDALGGTMATFGGQNVGAKKYDRLNKGLWVASLIGIVYALLAQVVLYFVGGNLSVLFLDSYDQQIVDASQIIINISAAFFIPLVFVNTTRFLIQGMGFSGIAILAGIFELVGRGVVGLFFAPTYGFYAICFASPVAWILADLVLIPTFYILKKKLVKKNNMEMSIN